MSRYRENTDDSEEVMDCIDMPSKYNVFLLNDDYTTMDFVVEILKTVFHKSQSNAESIMLSIHKNGKGLCGTYVFEVAETKVAVVKKSKRGSIPPPMHHGGGLTHAGKQ